MTATWIEPPPRQRRSGCLGKGCMMLIVFLILLAVAFFVGGYVGVRYVVTSTQPKEIPQVQSSEAEQEAVRNRWEEFNVWPRRATDTTAPTATPTDGPTARTPPPNTNRIELSATDI